MKNYYYKLSISNNSSNQEIKNSYRKLSKALHPDKNNSEIFYTQVLKEINEAYEILSNPEKRRKYDLEYANYNSSSNTNETINLRNELNKSLKEKKELENKIIQLKEKKEKPDRDGLYGMLIIIIIAFGYFYFSNNSKSEKLQVTSLERDNKDFLNQINQLNLKNNQLNSENNQLKLENNNFLIENEKLKTIQKEDLTEEENNYSDSYNGYYIYSTYIKSVIRPLRSSPNINSEKIYDIPYNSKVYVINKDDDTYWKIYVNGYFGYISRKLLTD